MGRKSKYNDDFPLMAEDCARRGMIDDEIRKKLGIGKTTYYRYLVEKEEFRDAIKRGKAPVDVEVENSLLKRTRGFEYEEVMVEVKPGKNEEDPTSMKVVKKTKKLVVPDVTACIFWLKNRRPLLWRDKHEFEHSGGVSITVITALPRSKPVKENDNKKKS